MCVVVVLSAGVLLERDSVSERNAEDNEKCEIRKERERRRRRGVIVREAR